MVCEPDLITTGEAIYVHEVQCDFKIQVDIQWEGITLNETGESFSILDP